MSESLLATTVLGNNQGQPVGDEVVRCGAGELERSRPILYSLISGATLRTIMQEVARARGACCVVDIAAAADCRIDSFASAVADHDCRADDTIFVATTTTGIRHLAIPSWVTERLPLLRETGTRPENSYRCFSLAGLILHSYGESGKLLPPLTPFKLVCILHLPTTRAPSVADVAGPVLIEDRWSHSLALRYADAQGLASTVNYVS